MSKIRSAGLIKQDINTIKQKIENAKRNRLNAQKNRNQNLSMKFDDEIVSLKKRLKWLEVDLAEAQKRNGL